MRLEALLGEDDLERRAARVAAAVESRLGDAEPRRVELLAVLGHPALAAAAAAAALMVWAGPGRVDPLPGPPTLEQVIGIESDIRQLESELHVALPGWIEMNERGGSR